MDAAQVAALDSEFTRPTPRGVRNFSVGILQLMRQQKLQLAGGDPGDFPRSARDQQLELVGAVYFLDRRHSIDQLRAVAALPRDKFFELLADYEFNLEPDLYIRAQREIDRTNAAVSAAAFDVEARPDLKGAEPVGKS